MFNWLRRLTSTPQPSVPLGPEQLQIFRPEGSHLLWTLADMESCLREDRAVIYITVRWSGQERHSRLTFKDFMDRIGREHSLLGVTFWVLSEHSEAVNETFERLKLPGSAATGYGAVAWLQQGQVLSLAAYAGEVGAEGLIRRTLEFWGSDLGQPHQPHGSD